MKGLQEPLYRCGQSEVYLVLLRQRQVCAYSLSLNSAPECKSQWSSHPGRWGNTSALPLWALVWWQGVGGTRGPFPGRAGRQLYATHSTRCSVAGWRQRIRYNHRNTDGCWKYYMEEKKTEGDICRLYFKLYYTLKKHFIKHIHMKRYRLKIEGRQEWAVGVKGKK